MASSMAHITIAIMAAIICKGSTSPSEVMSSDSITEELADFLFAEELVDGISLLQTDVVMSTQPASPVTGGGMRKFSAYNGELEGAHEDMLTRMWQWVTQAAHMEGSMKDATEAAKRFHKDFIAAALIMTCVLPWTSQVQSDVDSTRQEDQSRFGHMLPSGQSFRILCVLLLWLKHYCFTGEQCTCLEVVFVLAGALFDFVNQHADCEDDMWKKLSEFVPDQFSRLYPFYTLYVIVCYLAFFSSPSSAAETFFGGNMFLLHACSIGAWFLSVVFGCYLVLPVLASPPQDIQSSATAMICAGCVAMIILPRTLAAPVHSLWTWSEDQASQTHTSLDGVMYELFFARRSLLLGLAHFFFGLILARLRLVGKISGVFSTSAGVDACRESSCEISQIVGQVGQHGGKHEADLWKAFEDEAKREMLSSLSFVKSAEHMSHIVAGGYSMSPRSDHSD